MPKVSVIIPVYNVEKYLERCLDSVVNQTLSDIEIICINDCSTDDSLSILKKYAKSDKRIQLIDFKENQGAAVARNKGLETAKGEYLGFVDPDDYIDLNFYEELHKKAKTTNADIIKGNVKIYCLDGKILMFDETNALITENKINFFSNWWSAIYNSALVYDNKIKFPDECRKAQDVVFLNRCILHAQKVEVMNDIYYCHVKRENSLDSTGLSNEHAYSALKAGEIILQELNDAYINKLMNADCYAFMYCKRILNILIRTYFLTNDISVKKDFIKAIISSYDKCFYKELIDANFNYKLMLSKIKSGSFDELFEVMNKFENAEEYWKAEFLFNLKQNVKKSFQNA